MDETRDDLDRIVRSLKDVRDNVLNITDGGDPIRGGGYTYPNEATIEYLTDEYLTDADEEGIPKSATRPGEEYPWSAFVKRYRAETAQDQQENDCL